MLDAILTMRFIPWYYFVIWIYVFKGAVHDWYTVCQIQLIAPHGP